MVCVSYDELARVCTIAIGISITLELLAYVLANPTDVLGSFEEGEEGIVNEVMYSASNALAFAALIFAVITIAVGSQSSGLLNTGWLLALFSVSLASFVLSNRLEAISATRRVLWLIQSSLLKYGTLALSLGLTIFMASLFIWAGMILLIASLGILLVHGYEACCQIRYLRKLRAKHQQKA